MAIRSKKPCTIAGCPALTSDKWCPAHTKNKFISRSYDQQRGNSAQRGYDWAFRKLRLVALRRDDWLCQECLKSDRPTPAVDVDHIIPIVDAPELRLDLDNLRSLCRSCHHAKGLLDGSNRWGKSPNK